jgi:ribose transport system permease protein
MQMASGKPVTVGDDHTDDEIADESRNQAGAGAAIPAGGRLLARVAQYWLLLFLVLELVVFSLMRPHTFFTLLNLRSVLLEQAVPLTAALALALPLIVGEFDLSVGAIATGSAVVSAALMRDGKETWVAIAIAVGVAIVAGVVNCLLVARFEVTSLIGTLGMATVITGFIAEYTQGLAVNRNISPDLTALSTHYVLDIPVVVLIALGAAVIVWLILEHTVYGRQLAAIGANRRAAQLLGLRERTLIASTFILSSILAAVAGVLLVSTEAAANPTSGGLTLVTNALTAVFLGATCFRLGRFNVPGIIVGVLFVAAGVSGLSLIGLAAWVQDVFIGVALVLALAIAAAFRRASARS